MDRKLYQACVEGNTTLLMELLRKDPMVLERTITTSFSENPLHLVAMLGHVDFAREILIRKSDLAFEFDLEGFSPLHLASTRKNVDMLRLLLGAEPNVCLATDNEGRTALHLAAMKGRVEIMKELFQSQPAAIHVVAYGGRSILHLAVNHGRLDALKLLLQWVNDDNDLQRSSVTMNAKDDEGNTILHLAVAKKQIQIIKLLLHSNNNGNEEEDVEKVEVNELNGNGLTALDILAESSVKDVKDMEIGEIIRGAGGLRAKELLASNNSSPPHSIIRVNGNSIDSVVRRSSGRKQRSNSWRRNLQEHEKWLKKKQNTLMVVASLIASMAFQAMLNPPSGLTKEAVGNQIDPNGTRIPPTPSPPDPSDDLILFESCNTIGFVASMSVTVLLVSGLPIKRRFFIWVLMFILWVATTSMGISYISILPSMADMHGGTNLGVITSMFWSVLTIFLLLMHKTRFILWRLKKRRNKRIFLIFWCPIVAAGVIFLVHPRYM